MNKTLENEHSELNKNSHFLVIIPAYNEEENIKEVVLRSKNMQMSVLLMIKAGMQHLTF